MIQNLLSSSILFCIIIVEITILCGFRRDPIRMAIKVTCSCGKKLRARDEAAGKKAKCPTCGKVLVIAATVAQRPISKSNDKNVNSTHVPPASENPDWQSDLRPL
jgi:predicted RNA-binding Zn-ribbon protein involved in translation (DUF1610 family)